MKRGIDSRDVIVLVLIIVSGMIAAALFVMSGEAQALPALAVGSTVGACLVGFSERPES
jgi:hypothetical protein